VMPERAYQISSGVLLPIVLTIAYGGTFVLSVTRGNVPANAISYGILAAAVVMPSGFSCPSSGVTLSSRAARSRCCGPAPRS
jgi:hypothetical protein